MTQSKLQAMQSVSQRLTEAFETGSPDKLKALFAEAGVSGTISIGC